MPETWPAPLKYGIKAKSFRLLAPFRAPRRTEFEDGNQRALRSTTKNIATVAFTIEFSAAEKETFLAFVRDTLVDGTLRFTMPVWTGSAYAPHVCRFTQDWTGGVFGRTGNSAELVLAVEDYTKPGGDS